MIANNLKIMWQALAQGKPSWTLTDSDIHIWVASLEMAHQEIDEPFTLLAPDEKARAERFYFERDRNRFIAGRCILRMIIGGYLGMDPSKIEFAYREVGKPVLKSQLQGKPLEFNLSHSNELALYIFSRNHEVGIDVEYIRSMPDTDDFAEKFFSARETELINSLRGEEKYAAFFKLWTCKEALLKANGSGLTMPLSRMEIFLDADGAAALSSIGGSTEQALRWHLEAFNPAQGYQAAL
ncbi:MAG: 4'-phosphopantetheinyl transferase superfamily protein, partial [Anaerolineae bacterium]|nr:4'-phosphopantetheinyl transferase superfamily protein [Anaerolineae bacterium]